MFEDIDAMSAKIADSAFQLDHMFGEGEADREMHGSMLMAIKEDVNKVGRDLQSLEAARNSLSAWEIAALDQITPLMRNVADDTEKAARAFTPEVAGPLVRAYADATAGIAKYAEEITILLRNRLNLEKTREKEQRIEHRLGEASGS